METDHGIMAVGRAPFHLGRSSPPSIRICDMMCHNDLVLQGFGRTLPINVRCWAETITLAKTYGWVSPQSKGSLLLIGCLVSQEDAQKLTAALERVDEDDTKPYLNEIIAFCRGGAFLVEAGRQKNK